MAKFGAKEERVARLALGVEGTVVVSLQASSISSDLLQAYFFK